jgi:hypothetical protein
MKMDIFQDKELWQYQKKTTGVLIVADGDDILMPSEGQNLGIIDPITLHLHCFHLLYF